MRGGPTNQATPRLETMKQWRQTPQRQSWVEMMIAGEGGAPQHVRWRIERPSVAAIAVAQSRVWKVNENVRRQAPC